MKTLKLTLPQLPPWHFTFDVFLLKYLYCKFNASIYIYILLLLFFFTVHSYNLGKQSMGTGCLWGTELGIKRDIFISYTLNVWMSLHRNTKWQLQTNDKWAFLTTNFTFWAFLAMTYKQLVSRWFFLWIY